MTQAKGRLWVAISQAGLIIIVTNVYHHEDGYFSATWTKATHSYSIAATSTLCKMSELT
jgi:hypothetical protein